jgi:SAM-dependent methyltransferase
MSMDVVRTDFDRLAAFDRQGGWSHNDHYHPYLLRHVPQPCSESLEIGCGTGTFARLLAGRSHHVLALDLSPEMVRIARERSAAFPHIEYQAVDVLAWPFPAERFDCIASIATLHHLPLDEMLARMKAALRPGGILLVLDLYKARDLPSLLLSAVALLADFLIGRIKARGARASETERLAWVEHGQHDRHLPVPAVRRLCREILPGARVRRHLFWRYSIVWQKG